MTQEEETTALTVKADDDNDGEEPSVDKNQAWINEFPLALVYVVGVILLFVYLSISAAIFQAVQPTYIDVFQDAVVVRNTTFLDALYYAAVTLTTVGYGDIPPTSTGARAFSTVFILCNLILVGVALDIMETILSREDLQLNDKKQSKHMRATRKLQISGSMFALMFITGFGFFIGVESLSFADAIYYTVVTLSTVGYGDIHPQSNGGKVFTIFWILLGCLALLQMVSAFLDILMAKRRKAIKAQLRLRNQQLRQSLRLRIKNLTAQHKHHGNVAKPAALEILPSLENESRAAIETALTEAEFVLARLLQNNKVQVSEIEAIKADFGKLAQKQEE